MCTSDTAVAFPRTTVRVDVTQADIDAGERDSCEKCPIALALNRLLISGLGITVEATDVLFWGVSGYPEDDESADPALHSLELPPVASDFIERFDRGESVTPCSFQVSVRPQYVRTAEDAA